MTETTVIKADPTARRLMVAALSVCACLTIGVLIWLPPWLRAQVDLAEHQPDLVYARIELLLQIMVVLSAMFPALLGVLLIYVGIRVRRSGQFPYPSMRPLRDTPLLSGAAAVRRAQIAIVAGSVLLLISPLVVRYLQGIVRRLMYLLS